MRFMENNYNLSSVKQMKVIAPKCYPLPEFSKFEWLLSGEDYELEIDEVIYVKHNIGISHGTLTCTNYRIRFDSYDNNNKFNNGKSHISIPLFSIDKINKIGDLFSSFFFSESEHGYCIELECKDLRIIKFSFVPYTNSRSLFLSWIIKNIPPCPRIFANRYISYDYSSTHLYTLYDPIFEYSRLGINDNTGTWRLSKVNESFELCSSYPRELLVPNCVSDDMLFSSANFRTKGRIPVCSWRHSINGAALCRSSQPRVGIVGNQCNDDQFLILCIQVASQISHPDVEPPDITESLAGIDTLGPPPLIIFDPRPHINAVANTVVGAGFESSNTYRNCQVRFLGIPNIHCIRESFIKLRYFYNSNTTKDQISLNLNATEWYNHLTNIFIGCNKIANKISKGVSVLIHCSDGWDRTTQLISLVQILLDPFYRTLDGFIVLIEKEWLSFGHKFADRCRTTIDKDIKYQERSPIFLQFVECVYNLLSLYPSYFQFNDYLLQKLIIHIHSCKYSTFLYNCERQRLQMLLKQKSIPSFFHYVLGNRDKFTNNNYKELNDDMILFDETNIQTWDFYPKPNV